jgi:hypothetical protein
MQYRETTTEKNPAGSIAVCVLSDLCDETIESYRL